MNGFYEAVVAQLRAHGFKPREGKHSGSHTTWTNGRLHVTVSYNCKSRHTANAIMKDAGIDHRFR